LGILFLYFLGKKLLRNYNVQDGEDIQCRRLLCLILGNLSEYHRNLGYIARSPTLDVLLEMANTRNLQLEQLKKQLPQQVADLSVAALQTLHVLAPRLIRTFYDKEGFHTILHIVTSTHEYTSPHFQYLHSPRSHMHRMASALLLALLKQNNSSSNKPFALTFFTDQVMAKLIGILPIIVRETW